MSHETTDAPPNDKAVAKPKEQHQGVRTGGGQIARLQITSFAELERVATILGTSDIVPKDMIGKPANILLALMFGNEIGLTPAQALQNVMVVNGRPSLWGDAVMGLVENCGLQEWWKDEYKPDLDGGTWVFTTKRVGRDPVTRSFSEKDAVAAKLDKKEGPWQQYKPRMKFHRARSWALRDVYPDVLKGIRYHEEERDFIDTTATKPIYEAPKERQTTATAPAAPPAAQAPSAPAEPAKDQQEAAADPMANATETTFKCGGGATTEFEGDPDCFVIRDDQDPPVKYFHKITDWHDKAKAAKKAVAYLTGKWIEKSTKAGVVRWLVALSLKA